MSDKMIPPFLRHPKPKFKGKKPKPKKLNTGSGIKKLDLFKVFFGFDAGSDTKHQLNQSYLEMIRKLSKPQLSKLERRILRLKNKHLKSSKKLKEIPETCEWLMSEIQRQLQRSTVKEFALQLKVKKKLDKLQIKSVGLSSLGRVEKVKIQIEWVSINRLIQTYLSRELDEAEKLLNKGLLVRRHGRHGPRAIIRRYINDYLKSSH